MTRKIVESSFLGNNRRDFLRGFTLIELLVVISIIGILISLSLFGIQNSRKSARDAKRKSDLESIRSALEMYKADNGRYPSTSSGMNASSLAISSYISSVPTDPISGRIYVYRCTNVSGSNCLAYDLCAALETGSGSISCGISCGVSCNYKTTNP
jgi:general secretion pathway protein G